MGNPGQDPAPHLDRLPATRNGGVGGKVFVGFSRRKQAKRHAPRHIIKAFAESLQSQGVTVWLDEWQIHAGESIPKALEDGLRASDTVAFILSRDNVRRPALLFELGAAVGLGKRAVPIVAKDVEMSSLPYPLRVRQSLPKESPEETARKLLAEIAA